MYEVLYENSREQRKANRKKRVTESRVWLKVNNEIRKTTESSEHCTLFHAMLLHSFNIVLFPAIVLMLFFAHVEE